MNLPEPTVYRLRADAARLLLAGLGFSAVYGYLPQQPADRQQGVQAMAELLHQGLLQNVDNALRPEPGLNTCLCCLGQASTIFRVQHCGVPLLDYCIYPHGNHGVVAGQSAVQPGRPAILRLTLLPFNTLWPDLIAENEQLDLPVSPREATPPSATLLPMLEKEIALPGEQFRISALRQNGTILCQLFAVRIGACSWLYRTDARGRVPQLYSPDAIFAFMQKWKDATYDFG